MGSFVRGSELDEICKQVLERGYGVIRGVLDEKCVQGFVRQIEECMHEATRPELDNEHTGKRDAEGIQGKAVQIRAHDASFGRGSVVSLADPKSWPKGGARRVLECVPLGEGEHWQTLRNSVKLRAVLDSLLGEKCWDMLLNCAPESEGGAFIRHWYSPVVFPEHVYGVHQHPACAPSRQAGAQQHVSGEAKGVRPALLCSWKDEIAINGPMERAAAGVRWQPVNRRRFNSKGWHIDIGPGFAMEDMRTLKGDPRQGLVLLLLLSDWEPGCGGTAFVPHSHEWVRQRLKEASANGSEGLTHDQLNTWCQEKMKALTEQGCVVIPVHDCAPSGLREDTVVIEQVVGKKGDIVVCHPWAIHSGTTNMGDLPRLMCNGMITMTTNAFLKGNMDVFLSGRTARVSELV